MLALLPWLWAVLAAPLPAGTNLLAGDAGFTAGPGPWAVVRGVTAVEPPLWRDGRLLLPSDTSLTPAILPQLRPGATYTLACLASGREGTERLRLRLGDEQAELLVGRQTRTCQLSVTLPPDALDEPREVAVNLAVLPAADAPPGALWLDDVRLLEGSSATPAEPVPAVDATWDGPLDEPLWLTPDAALTVRAAGLGTAVLVLRDPSGAEVLRRELPAGGSPWKVPLTDLSPGFYEVRIDAGEAHTARWLPLLRRRTAPPTDGWSFDPAAIRWSSAAMALGLSQVRRVVAWNVLERPDGSMRWGDLDADLDAARAAGTQVTLVLDISPESLLPRGISTAKAGQPDMKRFLAFVDRVARRYAGRHLIFELDDQPYRTWPAVDYAEYLARFRATVVAADPFAVIAGLGSGFELKLGGRVPPFLTDAVGHDALSQVERVSWQLPTDLGTAPESVWNVGLDHLMALLPPLLSPDERHRPELELVAGAPDVGPLELGDDDDSGATSPWQLAARMLRARLLSLRAARHLVFPTGWRGGCGPREAAVAAWLERFDGAEFDDDVDLPAGLRGVRLRLPDGRGLLAVWDTDDSRWSTREAPAGGVGQSITLPADVTAEAYTLYGRRLAGPALPLTFEPVMLVTANPDDAEALADGLSVNGHRHLETDWHLAVREGLPGLKLHRRSGEAEGTPQRLVVRTPAGLDLAAHPRELATPADGSTLWLPITAWAETGPAPVRLLAEAGHGLVDQTRTLWHWPVYREGWPEGDNVARADTAAHLAPGSANDWFGPDDASLTARGTLRDGVLKLAVKVTDDRITGGDVLEVWLDLDPSHRHPDQPDAEPDHVLRLRPLSEDRVMGRLELQRLAPDDPPSLDDKAFTMDFRADAAAGGGTLLLNAAGTAVPVGWSAELNLPLTAGARERLERDRVLGLELVLVDDDGDGRPPTRVVTLGDPADPLRPGRLAQVWLAGRTAESAAPTGVTPAAPAHRIALSGAAPEVTLTPDTFAGAAVDWVVADDWIEGGRVLRVDRPSHPDEDSTVAKLDLPDGPARFELWVRARQAGRRTTRPRLGLATSAGVQWFEPTSAWSRLEGRLAGGAARLVVSGEGSVDVAELSLRLDRQP